MESMNSLMENVISHTDDDHFSQVMRKREAKRLERQKNYYLLADGRRIGYRLFGVLHVVTTSRKRFNINGKFYRIRRGVAAEIPEKWLGKVTDPQTIRKRHSKRGQGKSFRAKAQRKKRKDR